MGNQKKHTPIHVFFFRGLSTYGNDHAKWSIFDFGPVYQHYARALSKHDIQFHPVLQMGSGSPAQIAARALSFLRSHPIWLNTPVHFLAHSAGGLTARLILDALTAQELKMVLSCLTIGTPHRGSQLAQICLEMPERYKGSALALRSFGFDIRKNRPFFEGLTSGSVDGLFKIKADSDAVRRASIVCWSPRSSWCLPMRMFHTLKAFSDFDLPSDGVVERDTQPFGEVWAEFYLDHFRQVGFFGDKARFEQMCDMVQRFFKETQFGKRPRSKPLESRQLLKGVLELGPRVHKL